MGDACVHVFVCVHVCACIMSLYVYVCVCVCMCGEGVLSHQLLDDVEHAWRHEFSR